MGRSEQRWEPQPIHKTVQVGGRFSIKVSGIARVCTPAQAGASNLASQCGVAMHAVGRSEMRVSRQKSRVCCASAMLSLVLGLVLCGESASAPQGEGKKLKRDRGADFFADPGLRVFDIEVS